MAQAALSVKESPPDQAPAPSPIGFHQLTTSLGILSKETSKADKRPMLGPILVPSGANLAPNKLSSPVPEVNMQSVLGPQIPKTCRKQETKVAATIAASIEEVAVLATLRGRRIRRPQRFAI